MNTKSKCIEMPANGYTNLELTTGARRHQGPRAMSHLRRMNSEVQRCFDNIDGARSKYHPSGAEHQLFVLAKLGNVDNLKAFLEAQPAIDINTIDYQGRTALEIAIRDQNLPLVTYLLSLADIRLGDVLLHAVREGNLTMLNTLLDWKQRHGWDVESERMESAEFATYLSPLMLACHLNNYEMIRLLLSKGYTLQLPSPANSGESLEMAKERIDVFRAMTSSCYICLTSEDPILSAFVLSHQADKMAARELVYMKEYKRLSDQCQQFALDILEECRTSSEVEILLKQDHDPVRWTVANETIYPRLSLAVAFSQKKFVTHDNCQQVLQGIWTGQRNAVVWRNYGWQAVYFLRYLLILPFIYTAYLFFPTYKRLEVWNAPIYKFQGQLVFYIIFIVLLFIEIETDAGSESRTVRLDGVLDIFIWLYVASFIWDIFAVIRLYGLKIYLREWWLYYQSTMCFLFLVSFVSGVVSKIIENGRDCQYRSEDRMFWPWYDPALISEAFFAIAVALSMMGIIYYFKINKLIGPFQVSLGRMIFDVVDMFFIFFVTISAFAAGMFGLYSYYRGMQLEDWDGTVIKQQPDTFTTWQYSFNTLFWSMMGYGDKGDTEVVVSNVYNTTVYSTNYHSFTSSTGNILYGMYHVIMVIILLNMLIAVMSNTLTDITANADTEWKFGRSQLWLTYSERGRFLPNPLNIIPSPWSMYVFTLWVIGIRRKGDHTKRSCTDKSCCNIVDEDNTKEKEELKHKYEKLIGRLLRRYLNKLQQKLDLTPVVTPDLLEQVKSDMIEEMRACMRNHVCNAHKKINEEKIMGNMTLEDFSVMGGDTAASTIQIVSDLTTSPTDGQINATGANAKTSMRQTDAKITESGANAETSASPTDGKITESGANARTSPNQTEGAFNTSGVNAEISISQTDGEITASGVNSETSASQNMTTKHFETPDDPEIETHQL